MISSSDSVKIAIEYVKQGYEEWMEKEDGFCMFLDFFFANRDLFDEYQRRLRRDKDQTDTICHVQFGRSCGPFPRTVRTYYPLIHEKYPRIPYAQPNVEISAASASVKSAARAEKRKKKQEIREKGVSPF